MKLPEHDIPSFINPLPPRQEAFPLNPAQLDAVSEFDRNILVSAGAGTGKTRVLTQKYLRLLEERRATVNEIVAITFTKKAATEMRERIQASVKEHLERSEAGDEVYWKNQLSLMENARISTFHSFCLGLIKEYPLEAGIGPVHAVFGEGEEAIYLQETIEKVLVEAVHDPSCDGQKLTEILVESGWDELIGDLGAVYQRIRENGAGFQDIIAQSHTNIETAIAEIPYQINHLIEEVNGLLLSSVNLPLTERALQLIGDFKGEWDSYRDSLHSGAIFEIIPVLTAIKKALPRTLPKSIKDRVEAIHEISAGLTRKFLDEEALKRLPIYGDLLKRIHTRYSALKLELGALDFTDQLVIARNLLRRSPELAGEVRDGIRYLLVDEFQDTNSLQMELVDLLVGGGTPEKSAAGRFMAVGDIKQSIYRFRGAEAGVILELGERLHHEEGRLITLSDNYRSQELLIHFINEVSMALFADETFPYEPLSAHCETKDAAVEFILTGEPSRQAEADAMASRILELVKESRDAEVPVRFQDIVILFRAATSAGIYQQALQRAGIPFFTSSGSSFFICQEVADQLNLLRLVEQRFDGVALLSLLTSPFVGLSYESLLWIGEGKNLVEGFYNGRLSSEALEAITKSERNRLDEFRKLMAFFHQNREIMRIPEILRTAVERSDYLEVLWTLPDAVQRVANLEKLIAKAEEFCGLGFHDLHQFLHYIDRLEAAEVVEGEAQTQAEAGDAVRLMTIHRAKGLEFPIVFLPDLDRQFRFGNRSGLVFHKNVGLAFPIAGGHETGKPTLLEQFKALERREEIAELKRVLYVALTRAKQKLLLVGSGNSRSKGTSLETAGNWMKWFEILLPLDSNELVLDYQGIPVNLKRGIAPPVLPDKPSRLIDKMTDASVQLPEQHAENGETEVAAALVSVDVPVITLNVSEILTFKQCPRKYFWEYRLRLKPGFQGEKGEAVAASGSGSGLGSEIGSFFHRAIRQENPEWPEEMWEMTFGGREDAPSLKKDLQIMWTHYQESGFAGDYLERWDEMPFLIKLDSRQRIEGRFDRLIRRNDGQLHLVDFKTHRTDRASARAHLEKISRTYLWQIQLYAVAIEKVWGSLPDRAYLYYPYVNQSVEVPLNAASLDETLAEIRGVMDFMAANGEWSGYPMSNDCRQCGYRRLCGK